MCADRDWRKLKHVHVIGCSFAGVYFIRAFTNCQYLVITKVSKITKYRVSLPFRAGGQNNFPLDGQTKQAKSLGIALCY